VDEHNYEHVILSHIRLGWYRTDIDGVPYASYRDDTF
jgi:hypothetical protein